MTSPISPSAQSMKKDTTYYIPSADVVFLVENILFRVHRFFFERESAFFKTLFETPARDNEPVPGASDSSAIILEEVTPHQFSRFVWVFYNPKFSLYDEVSLDEWKSILELSTRWLFPEVKQLAIRELQRQNLSPVERIELYHRNYVDRSLLIGDYRQLCERPDPLNMTEGLHLGLETTLTIARAREEIRSPRSPTGVAMPWSPTVEGPELHDLIGKLFVTSEDSSGSVNGYPTIVINGVPDPKKNPAAGTNGHSTQNTGGLAAKTQQTERTQPKDPKNQKTNNQPTKNQETTPRKEANAPKGTTKANGDKKNQNKKDGSQTPKPIAGQQSAGGTGGGATNGEKVGGSENQNDSSQKDEAKTGTGTTAVTTEPGEGGTGTVDAQAKTTGDSDPLTTPTAVPVAA